MQPQQKRPTIAQGFNVRAEGTLIILNPSRQVTPLSTEEIDTFYQHQDLETSIKKKNGDSHWYHLNFDIFMQAYINAISDGQIYDLRGVCMLQEDDPAYEWYMQHNLTPEQVQTLERRVKILKPRAFAS